MLTGTLAEVTTFHQVTGLCKKRNSFRHGTVKQKIQQPSKYRTNKVHIYTTKQGTYFLSLLGTIDGLSELLPYPLVQNRLLPLADHPEERRHLRQGLFY